MIKLLLALAAAMAGATPSLAQDKPADTQAMTDWSADRRVTDEGGYAMGWAEAPVHLVEYVSLTCPHCARFKAASYEPLVRDYVARGRVHYEIRNYVRDPADLTGALLARCGGTDSFFAMTRAFLAEQDVWVGALQARSNEELNQVMIDQGLDGIATLSGMAEIAERFGMDAATRQRCVGGQPHVDRLVNMTRVANSEHGVRGTPSFLVNETLVAAHDWASLQPLLDAALAD